VFEAAFYSIRSSLTAASNWQRVRRIFQGRFIMAVNPDKLNAFMGKAVGDIGAALSANMVLLGDKLGLYKVMARARGPSRRLNSQRRRKRPNATFVSGWAIRPQADT
jgi:hypothetical protein